MYQAAVAKKETSSSSAGALEETEACSVPGGLANVKKHFESQEFSSSSSQSTVTQFHFQQRTAQEVSSSSELSARSVPSSQHVTSSHGEGISSEHSFQQNRLTSGHENHFNDSVRVIGCEELPKVSTYALKQQYEKSIEEATPSKQVKIDLDNSQIQWAPVNISSKVTQGGKYETVAVTRTVEAASSSTLSSQTVEQQFPPPPSTDLLQVPSEIPERCSSPQPHEHICPHRLAMNRDLYSRQRNLNELKRLYKHIHPEVRKNLERDLFSQELECHEEYSGDTQQARYMFESSSGGSPSKCMSPEREYLEWDEILKGEVQSMRWMFENKPLDSIKDQTPDENDNKNISQQEIIAGSDVKYTTWKFETQPIDVLGADKPNCTEHSVRAKELARGDVRTATWLFETQPLDSLNKIYQEDEQGTEVVYTKDISGGDVKTARYLFETQHLDTLGHTETIDESHFLHLKSELEEIKGEVKTSTKMFETLPMCVIRGDSGEMLEITKVRREETEKGDVKTSRWLFETQPLDIINKDPANVKLICGVSMEENYQGGVNRGRWLFETKTLDSIKDEEWENSKTQKEEIIGADVRRHCMVFETQSMDTLKDNANARPLPTEEIMGGDVTSARHLFETVPIDGLKELPEVGKLKKTIASEEEKGDVRHQTWMFERNPIEDIREDKKEIMRTINIEELEKGDVTNYKEKFETMDLSKCVDMQKIKVEGVTSGSVKSSKFMFESTPLYAIQDSYGHYHEVRTVRREEVIKGDVCSCRWMFETRPIDQFDDSLNKFQIIKGISKQEIESGDVKTAKWLFETQPLDAIKYFSNIDDEETKKKKGLDIERGDVKTCRWLFETQPMDVLYEKAEVKNEIESNELQKGDVKTCTWLFETQALDTIREESEASLMTHTIKQEDIQGKDVRLARFLFETENLDNITGEEERAFKKVTEIDIQSGDVSKMKYIFENQSTDIMTSSSEEMMQKIKMHQAEDIQKGNVVNCTWLFENQPIDAIHDSPEESRGVRTVTDIKGGNVDKGRFIFETYSLDKINEDYSETENTKFKTREETEKGDVKNYTMMFETQPLYAIKDKEGHYHEVTTVTKEEIVSGDVVGARWLFETKPLDSIKDTDEVYIIKAVTEEDVQKGDVTSARWRFETQPLDEITEDMKVRVKTVDDIQGGDVQMNKQRFETEDVSEKYVRTVSVSEIQKGDVRSATWMFETHMIDKICGEGSEYDEMEKVIKEEVVKGDVKQSVWLFEQKPIDHINDNKNTTKVVSHEDIPQADVKTTTWLFETTPLTEFNESSVEKTEIMGKSIKETLGELYSQKMVKSQGILIEADEVGDVRMAKYKLMNQEAPEIQREEVIRGDLENIMLNLLNRREGAERGIIIDEEERGNVNTTVKQLFNQERDINVEKEEIIRGDIQEAINNLLKEEGSSKRGILIQEDEKGDVRMTIYSLLNNESGGSTEKEDIVKGNVRGTLHRLLSNSGALDQSAKIKVGDTERGNVSFYSTCIESGALDYLRQLQVESGEVTEERAKEKIIGGDVEHTKLILKKNNHQFERTVAQDEIVPGDVHSTVKVFMMEPVHSSHNLQKEEIVKGDLRAALDSLTQAVHQKVVMEKEDVVKGDISTTLKSLEEAQHQAKDIEKPEIVRGDIRGALESLEKSATAKTDVIVEDVVSGDIKGTLKSLEDSILAVKEVNKEEIVKGDIQMALQNLHDASLEKTVYQHQVSEQGDVKGTIQLLLEPASPRMQRRASTEGDIKNSIKSLYEQEESQIEKEEVIKGNVQGTIKCLMQRKEHSSLKGSSPRRVKSKNPYSALHACPECLAAAMAESRAASEALAVKDLSQNNESQSGAQKLTKILSEENQSQSLVTQTTAVSKPTSSQQVNIQINAKQEQSKQEVKVKSKQQKNIKQHQIAVKQQHKKEQQQKISVQQQQTNVHQEQTKTQQQTNVEQQQINVKHQQANVKEKLTTFQEQLTNVKEQQMNVEKTGKQDTAIAAPVLLKKKRVGKQVAEDNVAAVTGTNETLQTNISTKQTQEIKTMTQVQTSITTEHKSVTQKQSVKNLKSDYRNLNTKGLIKKGRPEIHFPPPPSSPPPTSESELSLPPPPSPVAESDIHVSLSPRPPPVMRQDSDLPLPPPPPLPVESEPEFFPPPPQDLLPPPPSQQELSRVSQPAPVKPKGRPLFKVPEPPKQPEHPKLKLQKKSIPVPPPPPPAPVAEKEDHLTLSSKAKDKLSKHKEQTKAQVESERPEPPTNKIPLELPTTESIQDSPHPKKKVFVPPIKIPPPPEPTIETKSKQYARKFKTPLMLAEERYRKQKEEAEKSKVASSPTSPPSYIQTQASNSIAHQVSTNENVGKSESCSETTQDKLIDQKTETKPPPVLQDPTIKKVPIAPGKSVKPTINKNQTHELAENSTDRKKMIDVQSSTVIAEKQQITKAASKKHQVTTIANKQDVSKSMPPDVIVQPPNAMASSVVTEEHKASSTTSTEMCRFKQEDIQHLAGCVPQDGIKAPLQPTKIPKVTPNFKVKTLKVGKTDEVQEACRESTIISTMKDSATISQVTLAHESSQTDTNIIKQKEEVDIEKATDSKDSKMVVQMTKSKQKSKKDKEEKLAVPIKVASVAKEGQLTTSLEVPHIHGMVMVKQSHQTMKEEHIQVHEEVVITESKVHQQSCQEQSRIQTKKQLRSSQQLQEAAMSKQEMNKHALPELVCKSSRESTEFEKCEELHKLLTHIDELQRTSGKTELSSVKAMISPIPDWLIGTEEKNKLVGSQAHKQNLIEVISYVRNLAQAKLDFLEGKSESQATYEKKAVGGATPKISKISIGSAKIATKKKGVEEKESKQEDELTKTMTPELRMPPDLIRMKTPSPTFISIESTRKIDSPYSVTPSPPPSYRSGTTPTPPPRWSDSPTSRLSRATPSPTMSRSEKLAKLKDTTAKLSSGMTPPPPLPIPEHMIMHVAEAEESLSSSHQEVTIETHTVDVSEMVDSMLTVKDKREFFEEAQKAEVNKTYVRKDPIDIPERLGPDAEEFYDEIHEKMKEDLPKVDLSKLVNKFETPQPKVYIRRDPIVIPERLGSDTEDADTEINKKPGQIEELPTYDIKAIKNVFEMGEQGYRHIRDDKDKLEKREEELSQPTDYSETKSITEQFSGVDEFGNKVTGSMSESTTHSHSTMTRCEPPTYADVVRGMVPVLNVPAEASAEELLKSFQQSWAESENVFRNLGFTVSEQHTTQSSSHQRETVITENSSSRVRTVSGMSEEGISDGVADSGQTKLP
ncbi:xin actin-binding repeat-containing protein 2 isoform X2 [Denticeps clupeoides]|nr:xin actin-binding repeat-containing protein 2-like isoform X2 [Denticeps clupeoides]